MNPTDILVEDHLKNKYELLHEYIIEYLRSTGYSIVDLTLVEETRDNKVLTYLARKSDIKGEK